MTENQKLREALELCRAALDNPGLAATLRKYAIRTADEALATTEPAVNQQLTTEPIDERAAFESEMMRRKSWTVYEFQPHPHRGEYPHPDYLAPHANTAWAGWQARAALAARKPLSDMDRAVLRMPMDMALGNDIGRLQYYQRVQGLLDRLDGIGLEVKT